jgi:integrase/recombinase XerD
MKHIDPITKPLSSNNGQSDAPTSTALLAANSTSPIDLVVAGALSEHSRRAYMGDIRHFMAFLAGSDIAFAQVNKAVMVAYRAHLARGYAPSTVNRRLTVARRLVTEAWEMGLLEGQARNPAEGRGVAGLKDAGDRGKPALTMEQARTLLSKTSEAGDLPAVRDRALLHLLIGTGLRRSEIAAARMSDLRIEQGHTILSVLGKGNKRRPVKLTPGLVGDLVVWFVGSLKGYVNSTGHIVAGDPSAALFSPVKKSGRGKQARWEVVPRPLSGWGIWQIVTRRIAEAGLNVDTTPHGLRATFITLALEGGASISKVQDAAGHKDPRTTDRYRRRKANLDDNAADYVRL